MISKNHIAIYHKEGPFIYKIKQARACIHKGELDATIYGDENKDCAISILGLPIVFMESVAVPANSISDFEQAEIRVKTGWDTEIRRKARNIFHIYLAHHLALDHNVILFKKIGEKEILIKWECDSMDIKHYGETSKRNKMEIHCQCPLVSRDEFRNFIS